MGTNIDKAMKFGYWFSPPENIHAPGGNQLDVVFHETQTEGDYEAKGLVLPVKSENVLIESIKMHHPWPFERNYQVCAGQIEIIDSKGEIFEALSFGGFLKINSKESLTACTLESPAPILIITVAKPLKELFIDEIKILFAERRAQLLNVPHSYEERLINADPLELYISLINALIEKLENQHNNDDTLTVQLLNLVHSEIKRLEEEGVKPLIVPTLGDIL